MSDLISRTELFNRLSRIPISQYAVDERAKIYEVINGMETVKIVRCKDCKYYDRGANEAEEWEQCNHFVRGHHPVGAYDYCSCGERKEP